MGTSRVRGTRGGVHDRVLAGVVRFHKVQRCAARHVADRDRVNGDVLQSVQLQVAEDVRGQLGRRLEGVESAARSDSPCGDERELPDVGTDVHHGHPRGEQRGERAHRLGLEHPPADDPHLDVREPQGPDEQAWLQLHQQGGSHQPHQAVLASLERRVA